MSTYHTLLEEQLVYMVSSKALWTQLKRLTLTHSHTSLEETIFCTLHTKGVQPQFGMAQGTHASFFLPDSLLTWL